MEKEAVVVKQGEAEALSVMGVEVRFLCDPTRTDKAWSLMEAVVPKDAGPPPHEHAWDEAYYVIDGEVRFTIGERSVTAKPGDFIYAPGGTLHGFQGASKRPARILVFDSPAHTDAFFREVAREVKELPRELAKVPAIAERHNIHFAHS